MHIVWPILSNFKNSRYLLLLMCVICAVGNKVVANWGHTNTCFNKRPIEDATSSFSVLFFSVLIRLKSLMENLPFLRQIFKVFPKFYSKMTALWAFFEIFAKMCLLRLVFINQRNMVLIYFISKCWVKKMSKFRKIFKEPSFYYWRLPDHSILWGSSPNYRTLEELWIFSYKR